MPPDLTQTVVIVQHQNNGMINGVSRSPSMEAPNNNHVSSVENIYDKPDISPSMDSRMSAGTLTKNGKTLFVEPTFRPQEKLPYEKDMPPPVPLGPRPPIQNNNIMDSRQSMMSVQLPSNIDMEAVAWSTFNHQGGRLILPESGMSFVVSKSYVSSRNNIKLL